MRGWFWDFWLIELVVHAVLWIAAAVESVGEELRHRRRARDRKRRQARGGHSGNGVS